MKYPDITFEPFFVFSHRPRVMYSPGLRAEVGYEMGQLGGTKAVIITDQGIVKAGVCDMVADEVKKSDLKLVGIYDSIVQDARIDIINEGAKFYKKNGADCMIVIGGGSVMDTAKAINVMVGQGHTDFKPLADQAALFDDAKRLPPHIAFPTTAGTGSEVTFAMVVLDTEAHTKLSVAHPYCTCDLAMLDPELTVKLPAKVTAFTGMDALTHAVEGVTATSAEPIADALNLHAIRMIFKFLPLAVHEPDNIDARGGMLLASCIAGMGFGNSMTGAVHATAHALGGVYGIPHGLANAIMLPIVMDFNIEATPERFMMAADAMGINVQGMDPVKAGRAAVQAVRDLKKEIGLVDTLASLGVPDDKEKLSVVAETAMGDSQIGYNPNPPEVDDIVNLYLKAMK